MPRNRIPCVARLAACFIACLGIVPSARFARAADAAPVQPIPLQRAHAHNDYLHQRPLLDALDHGFCSIEADVWVSNDELLVAHTVLEIQPDRTLEALYLKPLADRAAQRHGWIFDPGRSVTLLIDFKSNGQETYPVLARQLEKYRRLFTPRDPGDGRAAAPPVLAIISGDRPIELIASDENRLCAIDGRTPDIDAKPSASLVPLISDAWSTQFSWNGEDAMPEYERRKLRRMVEQTHASGRRLRFWGAPDSEAVWSELYDAGVDLLGADDLSRLQRFLLARQN
jgi:hypothetical protein